MLKKYTFFSILTLAFLMLIIMNGCSEDDEPKIDTDNDGIADVDDNCPSAENADQADTDGDGIGDVCDDDDNDGVFNLTDNCISDANADQLDTDGDGIGNLCDDDDDNDTILDVDDNCPLIANTDQVDSNNNGIGDACDATFSFSKVPCSGGMAGDFACNDYDLLLNIPLNFLDASGGNDSWGWTDATTGKEYAIMGLNNGTAFIDITNPNEAIYVGKLPTATTNSSWRDVKVYNDHAFIVSEANGHGMQVFDLTRLRNVSNAPETFTADARYTGFGNAHNIVINEDTGFAYAVGTSGFNGGPHFVNIQNPLSPTAAGGYEMDDYSHDAQVVTYNGPDSDYTGKEILIGSNGEQGGTNEVVIVDVTDKANPIRISTISYSNPGYTHQGWFTQNQQYFIVGDELDETGFGFDTRTLVFDFTDLDNPSLKMTYTGPTAAIDHNGYVKGNTYYLANYSAGLRMIDVSNIAGDVMTEIGYFDTYPQHDNASFNGVWNVYPYLPSGNIVISDMNRGLFIVKKSTP